MIYITLDEIKDQISLHRSRTDLDEKLERLGTAAEAWAANFLNASLSDFEESPIESPPSLPEDLKSGILLHVEAHFDKDPAQMEKLEETARNLLWPYRTELGV